MGIPSAEFHASVSSVTYYIPIPSNSAACHDEKCFCKNEYLFTFRTFIYNKVQSDMFRVWRVIILLIRTKYFGHAWVEKYLYNIGERISMIPSKYKD